jgi:hypothetical protein
MLFEDLLAMRRSTTELARKASADCPQLVAAKHWWARYERLPPQFW